MRMFGVQFHYKISRMSIVLLRILHLAYFSLVWELVFVNHHVCIHQASVVDSTVRFVNCNPPDSDLSVG